MFSRIARTLTSVAELTDNTGLAHALRRDAMRATTATITHESSVSRGGEVLHHGRASRHPRSCRNVMYRACGANDLARSPVCLSAISSPRKVP
jgi:hypothetical protein